MAIVVPAVIPHKDEDIQIIGNMISGRPLWIHIDYVGRMYGGQMGGEYVPTKKALTPGVSYEVHIMEEDDGRLVDAFLLAGAARITLQYEAYKSDAARADMLRKIHAGGAEAGMALLLATETAAIKPLVGLVDTVQLMSIADIGAQGRAFDERVFSKIVQVKEVAGIPIAIDGGVTLERVPALVAAGIDRLIVGSAIMGQGDKNAAYEEFLAVAKEKGV